MKKLFVMLILVSAVTACAQSWQKKSKITSAIWSEDSTEIAYLEYQYEEVESSLLGSAPGLKKRNFEYRIVTTDPELNLLATHSLDGIGSNFVLYEIYYYLRNQGYFVVRVSNKVYIFDTDAKILHEETTNDHSGQCGLVYWAQGSKLLIPSPDGEYIAKASVNENCVRKIEILDANSNFNVSQEFELADSAINEVSVAWSGNNSVIVQTAGMGSSEKTWILQPDGNQEVFSGKRFEPNCFIPPTKSSNVSNNLEWLRIDNSDENNDRLVIEKSSDEEPNFFGCHS